jgi:hypothetical protein
LVQVAVVGTARIPQLPSAVTVALEYEPLDSVTVTVEPVQVLKLESSTVPLPENTPPLTAVTEPTPSAFPNHQYLSMSVAVKSSPG